MSARKEVHFSVRGSDIFPLDMLRYDGCWPFQSRDSALIIKFSTTTPTQDMTINLCGINNPTLGRWKSFGWEVVSSDAR